MYSTFVSLQFVTDSTERDNTFSLVDGYVTLPPDTDVPFHRRKHDSTQELELHHHGFQLLQL